MTHAKFNFNQLMLTLIFGIRASEPPPRAWRTTEKAGPDRVKATSHSTILYFPMRPLREGVRDIMMHVGEQVDKSLSISVENPDVLNIPRCTHDISLMYSW